MIIDITNTIHNNMPTWENRKDVTIKKIKSIDKGDNVNVSKLTMSLHCGTHIDLPYHHNKNKKNSNDLNLSRLFGKAFVYDLSKIKHRIDIHDVKKLKFIEDFKIVLFKTNNSKQWENKFFYTEYIAFTKDAALYLKDYNFNIVGIDYMSIDSKGLNEVHNIFYERDTLILEGLNLNEVSEGPYEFMCLPLKISNVEALPARVILKKNIEIFK